MSDNFSKIADDIQETYRYQGGQSFANRIRALIKCPECGRETDCMFMHDCRGVTSQAARDAAHE